MNNLTALIPFRNGQATIARLLDSLPRDLPVLIIDDQSDELYQSDRTNVRVIRTRERGYFAGAVNFGLDATRGDVLVLNQDAWLEGNVWQTWVSDWQTRGFAIAGDGVFGHPAWRQGYIQGTLMYLARAAIENVGAFNAVDYPLWGCTAEWQLRACRLGFSALPVHIPGLHHKRSERFGASIAQALQDEPNKQSLFIHTPPAISVVIPCYNYGRFLSDAIHSLIGGDTSLGKFAPQTFQSFEVVIVDDASADDSLEIAKSFADDWKAIRVYRNERNCGTAETINAGVRQAHGKYIAVLSADDMMETARLEKLYRVAEANPHHCVYDDLQTFKQGQRGDVLKMMAGYDFDELLYKNQISYDVIYPKAAWVEIGGYPTIFDNGREDWAFNVALGAHGYCGIHVPEPLLLYRREGHNRSLKNSGIEWRQQFLGKMQTTFPNLYRGERPTMCCGNGSSKKKMDFKANKIKGAGMNVVPLVGAAGMVAVEYLGQSDGAMQFAGEVTRATYLFGGKRRVGYIATEDLAGFLNLYHNRKQLFQRAVIHSSAPVKTQEVVAVAPRIEPATLPQIEIAPAVVNADKVFAAPAADEKPKRKSTRKAKDD